MANYGDLTQEELLRLKQIRNGEFLSTLRAERNLTLKAVAAKLTVSFQYLSEIEKGNKVPSDLLLHELAEVFELGLRGEIDLFHRYDRIPLLTMEELKDQESTHFAFAQLRQLVKDQEITIEQRQEFYAEFDKFYRDFINRVLPSKDK